MEPIVDIHHAYVARGQNVVLHDVSLRIDPGENVAILGPNGCGKSTLLKTLTCELYPLVRPETNVRILGRERWDLTELRRMMGVVSTELPGKQTLASTGIDMILTGFFSSSTLWRHLVITPPMRARAEEILSLVDAESIGSRFFGEMSAGQQRRILIGRAIAGASPTGGGVVQMLLLDEPSNALDLAAQHDLREMLRGLSRQGISILLITHHIADILPEIDRIIMMRDGRIIADGSKKELITERRLSDLFGREIVIHQRGGYFYAW